MSRMALLGAGLLTVGIAAQPLAQQLANKRGTQEANVFAVNFVDDSMFIADTVTPANNYNGPATTSGKLTYNRTSLAMIPLAGGQWYYAPHNLTPYSNTFSSWTIKTNGTAAQDGTLGPTGAADAWKITATSTPVSFCNTITVIPGQKYQYTINLLAGTAPRAAIAFSDNVDSGCNFWFDFATKTFTSTAFGGWTFVSNTAVSIGGGWYEITVTAINNTTDTSTTIHCVPRNAANGQPNAGEYFYAHRAKVLALPVQSDNYYETGASAYFHPRVQGVDPATQVARGYLCEPFANNFALWSGDLSNAVWTKAKGSVSTSSLDSTIAGQTMFVFTEDATNGDHQIVQQWTKAASATQYTFSRVYKAKERTTIKLYFTSGVNGVGAAFDLSNGTVASAATAFGTGFTAWGAYIVPMQDGRYRCCVAFTTDATTLLNSVERLRDGTGTETYTGNGTSGMYFGHAQLEGGATATSPIVTGSATGARNADQMRVTSTASFNIGGSRNSYYVKAACAVRHPANDGGSQVLFGVADTGFAESAYMARPAGNTYISDGAVDGSVSQASIATFNYTADTPFTMATRHEADNFANAFNAFAVTTDTAGTMPNTPNVMYIGCTYWSATFGNYWNGWIDEISFVPRAWTDDEIVVMNGNVRALYADSYVYTNHEDITAAPAGTGPWTYTFANGKDIGGPDLRRKTYVGILAHGGTGTTVDAFTANDAYGNAIPFTRVGHVALGASALGIFRSGTIVLGRVLNSPVVTIGGSAAPARAHIDFWTTGRADSANTPIQLTDNGVLSMSGTIDVPAGGGVRAMAMTTTDLVTHTWNVGTENWDEKLSATTMSSGMGYNNAGGVETGKTISVTFSATANNTRLLVVPVGAQVA